MNKISALGGTYNSLQDIKTRLYNSIRIGINAGQNLMNNDNIFIGENAGYYSVTTSNSIFLGNNAGNYTSFNDGYNNIIIGEDSNVKSVNNIISFGYNNSTDNNCISVGRNIKNRGLNNISIGFNNNIKGNNIINYGNDNNIITSKVFYHNLSNSNIITNDIVYAVEINNTDKYIKYNINNNNINIYTINVYVTPINNSCNINIDLYNDSSIINNNPLNQNLDINSINLISIHCFPFLNANIINISYDNLIINEVYLIDEKYKYNSNYYNISSGSNINIIGLNNIAIGNNLNIVGNDSIILGNDNGDSPILQSIIIGSNNFKNSFANNAIVIGNNNINNNIFDINTSPIIIGNNINDTNFTLNISNIICKNNDVLLLNSPVAIGYTLDEINNINLNNYDDPSLILKNGINTSKISIINRNNFSINITTDNNLDKNINYVLPIIPNNIDKVYLSTDALGNLSWNEVGTINANNLTTDILTANNINANIISGDGSKITNINISDKTTDNLIEGNNNLYFTSARVNNVFDTKIATINSDFIKQGEKNLYYNYENVSDLFKKFLTTITSDNIKTGSSNFYLNDEIFQNFFNNNILTKSTDNIKEGSVNLYYTEERCVNDINANISNIIINNINSDFVAEGTNNLYYKYDQIYNDFYKIISKINTDIFIEGKINKFYNVNDSSILISNLINNITTDNIPQGNKNLYFNDITFNNRINQLTTDNIIEGSENLFFTKNRFLNTLNTLITSDNIKQGSSNLYFTEELFYSNIISNITLDNISQGTSNKFIINNTIDSDLFVNGIVYASNIIIRGSNLIDLYNNYTNNINSNNLYLTNYYTTSDINVVNNSSNFFINLNIYNNAPAITINRRGPPLCVVGSNVGMNNLTPKFNLDVYGITNSSYFRGDGSLLNNVNLSDQTSDNIISGYNNLYLTSNNLATMVNSNNFYFNDIRMKGSLYTNNIVLGGANSSDNNNNNTGISFGGLSNTLNVNVDLTNNNNIKINHSAPPFIIVGNNVGINNLTPKYNLDISGYTHSDYFIGDGSKLTNINLGALNILNTTGVTENSLGFIINNTYSNILNITDDLKVNGNIYTNGLLIPSKTNTYDIGLPSSKWNNLYLNGSINLNGNLNFNFNNTNYSIQNKNNIFSIVDINNSTSYKPLGVSSINLYYSPSKYTTLSVNSDGSLSCTYNNNQNNKAITYNDLRNKVTYSYPLNVTYNTVNNRSNINLNLDPAKLQIDSNNNLTLALTKKISTFTLTQSPQYPNLYYYQFPITTNATPVNINDVNYYMFNIKSWNLNNNIFDTFVWVNTQNNKKKVITRSADAPNSISLGNSIFKSEGWQTDDNDCNNLLWFSNFADTIYTILEDIIS